MNKKTVVNKKLKTPLNHENPRYDSYKYIQPLKRLKKNTRIFFAADLETFVFNKEHYTYATAFKTSPESAIKTSFLNRETKEEHLEKESLQLIETFISDLHQAALQAIKKTGEKKVTIYFHNLGSFDGIFLIKNVIKKELDYKIILRNNSIYQIKIFFKSPSICLCFNDSLKLLSLSLAELAKNFFKPKINIKNTFLKKRISFFLRKIRKKNKKLRIRIVSWKKKIEIDHGIIDLPFLKKEKNRLFLKNYLKNDIDILYNIISRTHKQIWSEFKLNIMDSITIASLAFQLWRKNYYLNFFNKDILVYKTSYNMKIYKFLMKSYRGGIAENYIPYGKNPLFLFDINSSYPYSMLKPMPVGEPKWVSLSRDSFSTSDFFGFLQVTVEVPVDTKIPLIGVRENEVLIYPTGTFTTVLFSEELRCALHYGVKILKITEALSFQKGYLFQDYIKDLYGKKVEAKKESHKIMYKLLLNSLYGRFGMKLEAQKALLVPQELTSSIKAIYETTTETPTKYNYIFIGYKGTPDLDEYNRILKDPKIFEEKKIKLKEILKKYYIRESQQNIATQISSAIASYARVQIHELKMLILALGGILYYSDTDSVVTNIELPTSKELGGLKLETIIQEGFFIAPKVYYMELKDQTPKIVFKGLPLTEKDRLSKEIFQKALIVNEKPFSRTFWKSINKNLGKLSIESQVMAFQTSWETKKRKKIFDAEGNWIDTQPREIWDP